MESIDLEFDLEFGSEISPKEGNNCENSLVLVENQLINYSNEEKNEFIVNDVFLNRNNDRLIENMIKNQSKNQFNEEEYDLNEEELDEERESGFEDFMDDIWGEESVDSFVGQSLFGCICCNSCQSKSQKFINKSNDLIKNFKRQILELKEKVRQHFCDINSQLNETRLNCARLIVDLQIKLNEKNNQLKKIVDLSQFLSNNNEFLTRKLKTDSLKFENVCKENIELRDKLGIKLKIVLNSDECKKAIEEFDKNKSNISSVRLIDVNDIKTDCEDSQNNSPVSDALNNQFKLQLKPLSSINSSHNSDDLDLKIKNLLEKYNLSETNSSNERKRRTDLMNSPPRKHRNSDLKPIERNHSQRLKEHKNCFDYVSKSPEKLVQNNVHKSSNFLNVLTPITTYSKSFPIHKPLILSKSFQNINCFPNGSYLTTNCSKDNFDSNLFHNQRRLSPKKSNHSNSFKDVKIEPQSPPPSDHNLVEFDSNNKLKIKIKIPAKDRRNSAENRRYCKRCDKSFPTLTTKQFTDHLYNTCPAREVADKHMLKCDLCPRLFMNASALTSHQRAKHDRDRNRTEDKLKIDL